MKLDKQMQHQILSQFIPKELLEISIEPKSKYTYFNLDTNKTETYTSLVKYLEDNQIIDTTQINVDTQRYAVNRHITNYLPQIQIKEEQSPSYVTYLIKKCVGTDGVYDYDKILEHERLIVTAYNKYIYDLFNQGKIKFEDIDEYIKLIQDRFRDVTNGTEAYFKLYIRNTYDNDNAYLVGTLTEDEVFKTIDILRSTYQTRQAIEKLHLSKLTEQGRIEYFSTPAELKKGKIPKEHTANVKNASKNYTVVDEIVGKVRIPWHLEYGKTIPQLTANRRKSTYGRADGWANSNKELKKLYGEDFEIIGLTTANLTEFADKLKEKFGLIINVEGYEPAIVADELTIEHYGDEFLANRMLNTPETIIDDTGKHITRHALNTINYDGTFTIINNEHSPKYAGRVRAYSVLGLTIWFNKYSIPRLTKNAEDPLKALKTLYVEVAEYLEDLIAEYHWELLDDELTEILQARGTDQFEKHKVISRVPVKMPAEVALRNAGDVPKFGKDLKSSEGQHGVISKEFDVFSFTIEMGQMNLEYLDIYFKNSLEKADDRLAEVAQAEYFLGNTH